MNVMAEASKAENSEADVEAARDSALDAPVWSWLAIVTFVLSLLLSPPAAYHWVFWPFTFVVLVFSFLAVGVVAYGGRSFRGGGLACAAVFMGVFFMALGVTRFAATQQAMQSEARAAAEHWFDLIKQGKLDEAHQMTMGSEYRETPEIPLKEAYRLSSQLSSGRDTFFLGPPLKYLVSDPENSKVRFVNFGPRSSDEKANTIQLRFSIRYLEHDVPRETTFSMSVARYHEPKFEDHRWVMRGVSAVDMK